MRTTKITARINKLKHKFENTFLVEKNVAVYKKLEKIKNKLIKQKAEHKKKINIINHLLKKFPRKVVI